MAEIAVPEIVARAVPDPRPMSGVQTYSLVMRMWGRSALQYRASLVMTMVNGVFVSGLELAAVLVMFGNVKTLAGFSLPETLFLNGSAQVAFATSDLLFTGTEYLADRVRTGTFDSMLIRPVGVLPQIFADHWTPRRFSALVPAFGALIAGIVTLPIHWTPLKTAMVPYMLVCGVALYGAIWVFVGAFQIVATDAGEVMNAFTYGGQFLTSYPLAVFGRDIMLFLTFGLPLAFVNWQPALYILGHADPLGLPTFLRFAAPLFAAALWALALLAWRSALRHHRSTGS